jgi:hypothetical protein
MLSKRLMTHLGVAMGPVAVVILDTVFVGPGTSNELVRGIRSSGATPFIAWTVALFMGHWFHPVDRLKPGLGLIPFPWNYVIFAVLTALVGVLSFAVIDTRSVSDWFPAAMVVAGFAAGSILWPVELPAPKA